MSVIKNLRSLSTMEFYKNAITLRKDITNWMLRNFGIKRNARSIVQVIKNIDKEDQKVIDNIFAKYDKTQNNQLLKSFKIKVNNKEMDASDIENIYKSWRGSIRKYNSYHIIQNMDGLYYKLFKERQTK